MSDAKTKDTGACEATMQDHIRRLIGALRIQGARLSVELAEAPFYGTSYFGPDVCEAVADALSAAPQPAASDVPHDVVRANEKLGAWLAAALDDENVCAEMKTDIAAWFAAREPEGSNRQWPAFVYDSEATPAPSTSTEDWRDDPTADDRWNAGVDFAQDQLCAVLKIDPKSITWDGGTETVEGDVQSAICKVLTAWAGDDWMDRPSSTEGAALAEGFNRRGVKIIEMTEQIGMWMGRAERAEAENARLREALEPFARVAEHDIGTDEADDDLFRPFHSLNRAPLLTVGHLRIALAALSR